MKKFLRTEPGQRIDQRDFQHAVEDSQRDSVNGIVEGVLLGDRSSANTASGFQPQSFILQGFSVVNGGGQVIVVNKDDSTGTGKAILQFRDAGEVKTGCVIVNGPARKEIDVSSYPAGSYGVFIRFEFRESDFNNRQFWNANAATPVEFSRNIATRIAEDWSVTIELNSPGSEWTRIATINQASGAVTADDREFFFEGKNSNSYIADDTEWGDTNDRNNSRSVDGIFGLKRFTSAFRRMLQEIKGDGVGWWIAPAVAMTGLLDLAGTRRMTGNVRATTTDTQQIGDSDSLRWAILYSQAVFAESVIPPLTITPVGPTAIGSAARPYETGYFDESFISSPGVTRGAVALNGHIESGDNGSDTSEPHIIFRQNLAQSRPASELAEIRVNGQLAGEAFVEIKADTAAGTRDIRLNGTDVRLARNCGAQNGLSYATLAVNYAGVTGNACNAVNGVFTVSAGGNFAVGDTIIGLYPDGTMNTALTGTNNTISAPRVIGANQIEWIQVGAGGGGATITGTLTAVVLKR